MTRTILLIVISLSCTIDALCCSCYRKGRINVKDFNSYELVFVGRLISESRAGKGDNFRRTGVYKIIDAYKDTHIGKRNIALQPCIQVPNPFATNLVPFCFWPE